MRINQVIRQARQWVSRNPDKARQAIDKVGSTVNSKTGGKYADKITKAGDAVGSGLGVPKGTAPGQVPTPRQESAPGQMPPHGGQAGQTGQADGTVPGQVRPQDGPPAGR